MRDYSRQLPEIAMAIASQRPLVIVFPLYQDMTHLDFTGPHQVLSRLPGAELVVASMGAAPIHADGLTFAGLAPLETLTQCDVLCVPGGGGCAAAMQDAAYLAALRRLAADARYVTSVCTGSLILGAAGLLKGRRAACHWAYRELLTLFGAVPDAGRVVRDGNLMTGGGVTAGIDFGLALAAELSDAATAQSIQLALEYAPAPPFDAGSPETAPADVLRRVQAAQEPLLAARRAIVQRLMAASASATAPGSSQAAADV
jgi:transcriptional regulator GlxA family with amidase domain